MEEKEALEKRKRAQEEMKANRSRAREAASQQDIEDTSALDNLLEKLRNGDSVGRRARRARPSRGGGGAPAVPILSLNPEAISSPKEAVDLAMDMLATLKSDGFVPMPTSPTSSTSALPTRRRRLRAGTIAADLAAAAEGLELLEERTEQQEDQQHDGDEQEGPGERAESPAGSAQRMLEALNSSEN